MPTHTRFVPVTVLCLVCAVASAGEVDAEAVSFRVAVDGSYRFDVTLHHADAGEEKQVDLSSVEK